MAEKCVSVDLIDSVSGAGWKHLSFIMRYFIFESEKVQLRDTDILRRDCDGYYILFTGSVAEYLFLPFADR